MSEEEQTDNESNSEEESDCEGFGLFDDDDQKVWSTSQCLGLLFLVSLILALFLRAFKTLRELI